MVSLFNICTPKRAPDDRLYPSLWLSISFVVDSRGQFVSRRYFCRDSEVNSLPVARRVEISI